jgi:hypothetical protein
VAGRLCARLLIQLRFRKGTLNYIIIIWHTFANVPQNSREKPLIIFIKISIKHRAQTSTRL